MSSPSVTPDRRADDVPTGGRAASGTDRAILTLWWLWMATPLVLLSPAIVSALGFPGVREEFGAVFALAALGIAVAAPAAGSVVAHVGHRRRARRRFAVATAVSGVPVLFFLIFGVLLAECPDGYHC